jgi:hypothetical protein
MKLRTAGFFCELPHGEEDEQSIRDVMADVPQQNEQQIIEYLRKGILFIGCPGVAMDALDPSLVAGSPHTFTDGVWAWPGDLPYYVERYHVRLPNDFVIHMERNRWQVPRKDTVSLEQLEL